MIDTEKIDKAIDEKRIIRLEREHIDPNCINGVPLLRSKNLLLIEYYNDFYWDGYKVVRIGDVTGVYYNEEERFYERILKQEGIYKGLNIPELEGMYDWKYLFEKLKKLYQTVIIECEEYDIEDFYIGKVLEIKEKQLQFLYFDTMGRWRERPNEINYNEITSVSFADRYSAIYSKYCQPTGNMT